MRHQHAATQLRGGICGWRGTVERESTNWRGEAANWREAAERESTNWREAVERESTNWRGESANWRGTIFGCVAIYCGTVTGKWLVPDVFRFFSGKGNKKTGDDGSTATTTAAPRSPKKEGNDDEEDRVPAQPIANTPAAPVNEGHAHNATRSVPPTAVVPATKEPLAVPSDGRVVAATATPTDRDFASLPDVPDPGDLRRRLAQDVNVR